MEEVLHLLSLLLLLLAFKSQLGLRALRSLLLLLENLKALIDFRLSGLLLLALTFNLPQLIQFEKFLRLPAFFQLYQLALLLSALNVLELDLELLKG